MQKLTGSSLSMKKMIAPHVEALRNALAFHRKGNLVDAQKLYLEILESDPNHFDSLHMLGVIFRRKKNYPESETYFRAALNINANASIYSNYGLLLMDLQRLDDALKYFKKSILLEPEFASAYYNFGLCLQKLERLNDAVASCLKGVQINTYHDESYFSIALIMRQLNRIDEAQIYNNKAILINPRNSAVLNLAANISLDRGMFSESKTQFERAMNVNPNDLELNSRYLCASWFFEDSKVNSRLQEAKSFGKKVADAAKFKFNSWRLSCQATKLRIGFVSGDYWSHPVAFFLESVLSNFDRSKIDILGYTNNLYEDNQTQRIKEKFTTYKSVVRLDDVEFANEVHSDAVHILIDLGGHTASNRLPAFAYKPAPVQISWLGYWATTGVQEIDYIIGDPYVTPHNEASHFVERIKRLPETYFCFTPPVENFDVDILPALKNDFVTFGCFNNARKINGAVLLAWAKILSRVPDSRLFLKSKQYEDPENVRRISKFYEDFGVNPKRIIFEGQTTRESYLKAYNKVDIALDPFVFPGGTTSVEGLWMGVPVITRKGSFFIGHNGETIAHNSGQAGWIAEDEADYIEKAICFSNDLQALAKLRAGLRAQVLSSPLFDAKSFARNFEQAMFEIWEDYMNGSKLSAPCQEI